MYFPQASTSKDLYRTFSASVGAWVAATGRKKVGTLNCVESEECTRVEEVFAADAKVFGYEHVYKAKASLAQPDYTAECLAARNAGVEFFFVNLVQTGTRRVAAACARQGYNPPMGTSAPGQADSQKDDPDLDGLLVASHVFPYFQSGTPATDEFQAAMRTYGNGAQAGVGPAMGWVAGKVLEKAGAMLPEPPTSAGILAGLWSLKNDTLGGLTMPLTFIENKPPPHQSCWWDMHIANGKWVSPDQYKMHCRSDQ
jgi:branched-chain amino acid transport system substrate-binding protein